MIEHLVRTLLARKLPAAFGAGRAEDAQSGGARHLRGGDADGAACAVDQNRLAGHRAPSVEERAPCRDIRNADAGAFGKRHVARKVMNLIDRAERALGVRAERAAVDRAADVHAVARLEVVHIAAHGCNDARGVRARRIRQRRQRRVLPAADVGVDRIDAGGFHIDKHLPCARRICRARLPAS